MSASGVGHRDPINHNQPVPDGAAHLAAVASGVRRRSTDDINDLDDALVRWVRQQPPEMQSDARIAKSDALRAIEADPSRKSISIVFCGAPAGLIELLGGHQFAITATVAASLDHLMPPQYQPPNQVSLVEAPPQGPIDDPQPPPYAAPQARPVQQAHQVQGLPRFEALPGDATRLLKLAKQAINLDSAQNIGATMHLFISAVQQQEVPDAEKLAQLHSMARMLMSQGQSSLCPMDVTAAIATGFENDLIPAMSALVPVPAQRAAEVSGMQRFCQWHSSRTPESVKHKDWPLHIGTIHLEVDAFLGSFDNMVRFGAPFNGVSLAESTMAALIGELQFFPHADNVYVNLHRMFSGLSSAYPRMAEPARDIAIRILSDQVLPAMQVLALEDHELRAQRFGAINEVSKLIDQHALARQMAQAASGVRAVRPDAVSDMHLASQLPDPVRILFQQWAEAYRAGSDRDFRPGPVAPALSGVHAVAGSKFEADLGALVGQIAALPSAAARLQTFQAVLTVLVPQRDDAGGLYNSVKRALDAHVVPAVSNIEPRDENEHRLRNGLLRQLKDILR
ncbi:MAG: hypothetical protein H7346_20125 [Burkholderiaceae bacterium]|nr:hypothetical protein [Burkholderiaceae bacterium]